MIRRAALAFAAICIASSSPAATIDFEGERFDSFGSENYAFLEDGFRVEIAPTSIFGMYLINDPAANLGMCGPGCASNGTTAYYGLNETSVSFFGENGGLFSLDSFDAAQTFLGLDRPLTLTVSGVNSSGVVTSTILVDSESAGSFATFSFKNFVNLSSLTIAGSQDFPEFALDNVILSAVAVPEPATWTMLVAGFGAVGGALRRRRVTFRLV